MSVGRTLASWAWVALLVPGLGLGACAGGERADEGAAPAAEPAASAPAAASSRAAPGAALLDPNRATEAELAAVPGMTAAVTSALLAARPFADMLAVDAALAPHVDEAAREALYGHVWIPLDLNAASEAEILLIPGVGPRMAHEFEEYRPYDGMARFRREIGKYVDEREVARLERYVRIAN